MGNSWKPGKVVQYAETLRSYEIQTDEGRKYRQNRRMLIKSSEDDRSSIDSPPTTSTHERPHFKEPVDKVSPLVEGPTVTLPHPEELCSTNEDIKETTMTSDGRVIRKPLRFKNYVLERRSLSKY